MTPQDRFTINTRTGHVTGNGWGMVPATFLATLRIILGFSVGLGGGLTIGWGALELIARL